MSAATLTRTRRPAARGLERFTLLLGLALVDWSHSRAARRALTERTPRRPRVSIDEARLDAARLQHDSFGMTRFR